MGGSPVDLELKVDLTDPLGRIDSALDNLSKRGLDYATVGLPESVDRSPRRQAVVARRAERLCDFDAKVGQFQAEQLSSEPRTVSDKVQQEVLRAVSVEDDGDIRTLWAQLIVNLQAGMQLNDYLLHVLVQINGEEALYLNRAVEYDRASGKGRRLYLTPPNYKCPPPKRIDKLISLRLLKYEPQIEVNDEVPFSPERSSEAHWSLHVKGEITDYALELTDLAYDLYDAAMKPMTPE